MHPTREEMRAFSDPSPGFRRVNMGLGYAEPSNGTNVGCGGAARVGGRCGGLMY